MIELENPSSFAVDLRGWSLSRSGSTGEDMHLFTNGSVQGDSLILLSGAPSLQTNGNASEIIHMGENGFLGVGEIDGLANSNGRLELLYAFEDDSSGQIMSKVVWTPISSCHRWFMDYNATSGDWIVNEMRLQEYLTGKCFINPILLGWLSMQPRIPYTQETDIVWNPRHG